MSRGQFLIVVAVFSFPIAGNCLGQSISAEQNRFYSEQKFVDEPVRKPVKLLPEAFNALARSEIVADCLTHQNEEDSRRSADWFVGSILHLGGTHESALVVLPNLDYKSDVIGGPIACFTGASNSWFWILRPSASGYDLVLTVGADFIEVSTTSRSHGLRDIVANVVAGDSQVQRSVYRFDGSKYIKTSATATPKSSASEQ
jgi:hypothetical protein